jgi:hypothetical protein
MEWSCSFLLAVYTACSAVFSCRTRRQASLSINQEGGGGVHGRRSRLESRGFTARSRRITPRDARRSRRQAHRQLPVRPATRSGQDCQGKDQQTPSPRPGRNSNNTAISPPSRLHQLLHRTRFGRRASRRATLLVLDDAANRCPVDPVPSVAGLWWGVDSGHHSAVVTTS